MSTALQDAVVTAEQAEAAAHAKANLWRTAAKVRRQELADLEARIGGELLNDPERADELMAQVGDLRRKVEVTEKTADAARRAWEVTRAAGPVAQAAILKEQAAELWAAAAERQATTQRLLAELQDHEGVTFGVTEVHPFNGGPASSRTDQLIEQARRLDASAVALVASVRGEGVQVSLGPIAPGGMQTVCVQASATCEPGQSRRFEVLIDGEPWQQDDGRHQWLQVSFGEPTVLRTLEVPFGATVEVRGESEHATTARQPVAAAA